MKQQPCGWTLMSQSNIWCVSLHSNLVFERMKFLLTPSAVCVLVQQGAQPLSSHTEQGDWSPHNPYPPWHSLRALLGWSNCYNSIQALWIPSQDAELLCQPLSEPGNASKLQPAFMGNSCVVHPLLLASGRFFHGQNPTWAPGMCYWITTNSFLFSPQSRSSLSSHLTLKFRYYRFLFLLPDWSFKKRKNGKIYLKKLQPEHCACSNSRKCHE